VGIIILLTFLVLFILGVPVVLAILVPSILYVLLNDITIEVIAQRMLYSLDSFPLVAVPVFIFVGNLMNSAGITDRIFRFADTLAGRLPGGLAQVNIFGSLIFSGISGAALADVGGLGKIEIQAMREKGFDPGFASAVTSASAIVGPIFPPSIPLIIYGSVTSVSIVKLLVAGIVPAILAVSMLMVMTGFLSLRNNFPRATRWPRLAEVGRDFVPALPALMAPAFLIAGMLSGFFTPTEAAAVTVVYVLLISSLIYRELTWNHLLDCALEAVKSSGAILIIVAAASIFGWILAIEQIPQMFAKAFLDISTNKYVLLLIVNLILLLVGMFLDSTTATLLVIPILAAPVVMAGVDPVHLGIIAIFNLMLGLITPPMGLSLFLVSEIAGVSIQRVLRSLLPYYFPLFATLALITCVPALSLWIPSLLGR
jgi:tripartite ATP-independent transporter DctM subunit